MTNNSPEQRVEIDKPRADLPLDINWWTKKLFEQLAYSEFGEFDEMGALENIKARYGVEEPEDDVSWWALQDRLGAVASYDEHDFIVEGEFERAIEEVTRYDDRQGEA